MLTRRGFGSRERIVRVAHEQVVVFDTGGPIRCEAILPSNTHGTTPAGRACRGQFKASRGIEDAKAGVCHRRAALQVKQRSVPGVTDLAGEEADATGFGAGRERRIGKAEALVAEIRPIALSFQAKHPLAGLPAIPDLAADRRRRIDSRSPRRWSTTTSGKEIHSSCGSGPSRRWRRYRNRSSHKWERRRRGGAL